jgi:hypothetical protein
LKNLFNNVLNEERFDAKCFLTDRALVLMDFLRHHTIIAEDDADLHRAYEYSQQLY